MKCVLPEQKLLSVVHLLRQLQLPHLKHQLQLPNLQLQLPSLEEDLKKLLLKKLPLKLL